MSWAENEKLNEWIERAYQNGKREEQERITKLLIEADTTSLTDEELKGWYFALIVVNGKSIECECDTCDNPDCDCRGRRCSFCLGQDENR